MRAVNLVPPDLRRAGAGTGSDSPLAVYALLAGLALAVVLVGLWAMTSREVKDREAEVTQVTAEAVAAEAQAGNLAGYEGTVKVADARRASVVALIEKRVDWASRLDDISRTLPGNVWITTMGATVAPGVGLSGGGGNPQRAAVNAPAIELTGCTTSQEEVARVIARLRSMKGVTKVGLASSEKSGTTIDGATSDAAGGGGDTCSQSSKQRPKFSLVVFYGTGAPQGESGAGGNAAAANGSSTGGAQ